MAIKIFAPFPDNHDFLSEQFEETVSVSQLLFNPEILAKQCNRVAERQIIISMNGEPPHSTLHLLADKVKDKTVVITAATIPVELYGIHNMLHFGCALAFVQCQPPGIYVARKGKCYCWNDLYSIEYADKAAVA